MSDTNAPPSGITNGFSHKQRLMYRAQFPFLDNKHFLDRNATGLNAVAVKTITRKSAGKLIIVKYIQKSKKLELLQEILKT